MNLRSFGYPERVGLLACPFCHEMFEEGEAKACPVCGMALTKFEKLPLSLDAAHDEGGVPTAPEPSGCHIVVSRVLRRRGMGNPPYMTSLPIVHTYVKQQMKSTAIGVASRPRPTRCTQDMCAKHGQSESVNRPQLHARTS